MDIFTHFAVGFATGTVIDKPITCGVIAILPDVFLFSFKRLKNPTILYKISHTVWIPLFICIFNPIYALAYLSHIVLDVFTHGGKWKTEPFLPIKLNFGNFHEWEFFNKSYLIGLIISILWITIFLYI